MLNPSVQNICLSQKACELYARHLRLNDIGINGQKRLTKASLLFIGAGGLASSAVIYLAASGIGCIGIIDNDIISRSNLHRQILYNSSNINRLKVQTAKLKIHEINPNCQVITYIDRLNTHNAIDLIKKYDLIIDTCDNFETRYIIDSICYKLHKVHIYGAIQNFEGQISVFNYKGGPRYSNLYTYNSKLDNNNCSNAGVLGILPGIIGLLQATEAVKIILGTGKILSGYVLVYNALYMSFKKLKINTKTNNIINKSEKSNLNLISYEELNEIIIKDNIIMIDIRQNIEFKVSHMKYAINIPLNYMKNKSTIKFIIDTCMKKIPIIYCSSDSRAITASQILQKNKIRHYRLENGLNNSLAYIQKNINSNLYFQEN
uniref:molybdopterin-synthase adenylyltransferase n=1 Tax=Polyopes affinis TaxID=194519 RepID=UPI002A7F1443|nr:molybdopterin-synthase adenylyltransferase [Polyopes affinis]WOL37025.1 molybdopterin-synthase adenylyltransferase [Polyopes affinis]